MITIVLMKTLKVGGKRVNKMKIFILFVAFIFTTLQVNAESCTKGLSIKSKPSEIIEALSCIEQIKLQPGPRGPEGKQGPKGDAGARGAKGEPGMLLENKDTSEIAATANYNKRFVDESTPLNSTTIAGPYRVDLLSCSKKSSRVRCEFSVTNEGGGENIYVFRDGGDGTKIYMSSGLVSVAQEVYIGNVGGNKKRHYKFKMPLNLPIKGSVSFSNISDNEISLIQLRISSSNVLSNPHIAEFRNINLVGR